MLTFESELVYEPADFSLIEMSWVWRSWLLSWSRVTRRDTCPPLAVLHLCPMRLSCLGKVACAVIALHASQGQREWAKRWEKNPPQQMKTATSPGPSADRCSADSPRTCAAVSAGCHSRRFYRRMMRVEGKRHIFRRSDSVEAPWPRLELEYAPPLLCGADKGGGSSAHQTSYGGVTWFLQGFHDRTTFQQESGLHTPTPLSVRPPGLAPLTAGASQQIMELMERGITQSLNKSVKMSGSEAGKS